MSKNKDVYANNQKYFSFLYSNKIDFIFINKINVNMLII